MNIIGMIGGIAPGSTVEYYKLMIASYSRRTRDGSYPAIIINSIDLAKMLALIAADDLDGVTAYLLVELDRLAAAGAGIGLFASNTPHIVFERLERVSPLPLVSIVEATCRAAVSKGIQRAGLFGTRFTMEGSFYPEVFTKSGITIVRPDPDDVTLIHERYINELINGIFVERTRAELLAVVERMRGAHGIDAVILGGTELPLILGPNVPSAVPLLDTAIFHVEAALDAAMLPAP